MNRFVALFVALVAGVGVAVWYYRAPHAGTGGGLPIARNDDRWIDDLQSRTPRDVEAAWAAARLLIAGRLQVDAIFCANDMMAVGCCAVLAEAGIAISDAVGVAGFDDVPIAHYVSPGLTTMNVRIAELGATATERLIALIDGVASSPETTILTPQLVVRESTRRGATRPTPTNSITRELQQGSHS